MIWASLRPLLIALGVIILWEGGYRAALIHPLIFASPSLVLEALLADYSTFAHAFWVTALEVLAASVVSIAIGVLFGVVAGNVRFLSRLATPLLGVMMAVPFIVLYPVLMAWFGPGPNSKIVYGILVGVFPIALNTIIGIEAVERGYVTMSVAMGASRLQRITHVMIPLALPAAVSGLRLGLSLVVAAVVLGEMLASFDGLGFWISYHRSLLNSGHVYLGIVLVLVMTAIVNGCISLFERQYQPGKRA